jgi:hypothetical protein
MLCLLVFFSGIIKGNIWSTEQRTEFETSMFECLRAYQPIPASTLYTFSYLPIVDTSLNILSNFILCIHLHGNTVIYHCLDDKEKFPIAYKRNIGDPNVKVKQMNWNEIYKRNCSYHVRATSEEHNEEEKKLEEVSFILLVRKLYQIYILIEFFFVLIVNLLGI